jgi:hypothetical protein
VKGREKLESIRRRGHKNEKVLRSSGYRPTTFFHPEKEEELSFFFPVTAASSIESLRN